ncbi:MAG: hypothetical protein A2504_06040 [Bdellovibrionales bacterium RIFOXYD12_FULL_39_22]|nr:MAG: hypothetical protein A2385_08360 [Bdellovibrionales bacterium RIFOXYB1_FULL_39_21]OFZ45284.1 MAG: hypothetical protein A2485_06175 [Bdellovibrionales bacterium RIFOXYC12_FULL_39_17]OFZ77387.1 MAG: hypothetical protein A2560_08530 [Bdellovibrionales bacterium RIFOXYD1_FULL_39_84]OFZ91516.1 MAG: hypothetical protein A2504_06040 [Bdellovibrionales bacterium RIFOXYD12_FULL_39_22]
MPLRNWRYLRYNRIMKISKKLVTFFLSLTVSLTAQATINFSDAIFPELVTSGRALSMGNAYLSTANDSASAFYNPAGLGSIRNTHLHLSNFSLEANKAWVRAGTSGTLFEVFTDIIKGFSMDGSRELLLNNKGTLSFNRIQALPNFATRFLSAGYLFSKKNLGYIGTEEGDPYEYATRLDHGPYGAFTLAMMGGIIKLGVTGTWLFRTEAMGTADPNVTFDLADSEQNKGSMILITGGAKLTLPIMFLPTFSATLHNAMNTPFTPDAGSAGAPELIKRSLHAGFSLTPQIANTVWWRIEVNYKDLTNQYENVAALRKTGLGMEFDFSHVMFIRIGYGDGFGSAGLGIKTQMLECDLTTYAVDLSDSGFRGEEDRRFMMNISVGI